jgi:hypothetical protein
MFGCKRRATASASVRHPHEPHAFLPDEIQVVLAGPPLAEEPPGLVVVVRFEV